MSPHLRALYVIAGAALAGAVVLTFVGMSGTRSSYSPDLDVAIALGFWSNFLLILAAVAGVGALVLGGVERVIRAR